MILGVNISHNPSICLYENKKIKSFYNEERFINRKNFQPTSNNFEIFQSILQKITTVPKVVCYSSYGRFEPFTDEDYRIIQKIQNQLNNPKYYFDENYSKYLYQPTLRLAKKIAWIDWELYDKYFINGFGKVTNLASKVTGKFDYEAIDQILVDGTAKIANLLGRLLRTVQTGKLQNYVLYVTCGLIILMIIQTF